VSTAVVEARELRKAFASGPDEGVFEVLGGLSFSVPPAEFLTVVGPSGCGKTTLLRLIGGFASPDSGELLCDGELVRNPDSKRVMMFQDFDQLFPWKRLFSNVEFPLVAGTGRRSGGAGGGASRNERLAKVSTILREVGLAGYEEYFPRRLSGGMKQRAALARTLVGDPELVLMDEPFGSVDARKREELQELLLSIRRTRRFTAIFVTHDIQEAVYLGDRVVVMGEAGAPLQRIVSVDVKQPRRRDDPRLEELRRSIRSLIGQAEPCRP